jgi:hypothetical protein
VARAAQELQPRAARVLGQVDDEVVASRAQCAPQPPFAARLREHPVVLEAAVDRVQFADRRVAGKHRRGLAVDERVDLGLWRRALEHAEHGRGEQHVAVMAQLDHQRAPDAGGIDRVGNGGRQHAVNDS